jgi:hypothetical protein
MTGNEFNDWLDGLEVQTLTDELKETIKDHVEDVIIEEITNTI